MSTRKTSHRCDERIFVNRRQVMSCEFVFWSLVSACVIAIDISWLSLANTNLSKSIEIDLREKYINDRNFCNDDIYRCLRMSQRQNDEDEEARWLARLLKCKRKDLKQLQRKQELRQLTTTLNRLLSYVELWLALQIETFHRLLNLKCSKINSAHIYFLQCSIFHRSFVIT